MKIQNLTAPNLNPQNFLYSAVGIRPYRQGGIRLQHELINDKHVFHNYGHGGAGISLAYGSACVSVASLEQFVPVQTNVHHAVIGSGIIGLFTALQLAKSKKPVTIYSEVIPETLNVNELITSQIAAGLWFPFGYDCSNRQVHQKLSKLSFQYYSECIKNGKYKSIQYGDSYENLTIQQFRSVAASDLITQVQEVKLTFDGGQTFQKTLKYRTMRINTVQFLQELISQAKSLGVKFIRRRFNCRGQVLSLQQQCIWNCTAMASQYLFNDNKLIPTKGHLLYFKNVNRINYILHTPFRDHKITVYAIGDNKVAVGYTFLKGETKKSNEEEQKMFKEVIWRARQYFKQRGLKPKL